MDYCMKRSKQEEKTGVNVLIYCRVSTDEQADGCSLDMQELYLRRFCDANEYNIIDIYKEDYSAKHYDMRRPEMAKMYNYCKKHKREVDKILFLRLLTSGEIQSVASDKISHSRVC